MFKQCRFSHIHKDKTSNFQLREVAEAQEENHHLELFLIYSFFFYFCFLKRSVLMSSFVPRVNLSTISEMRATVPNSSCLFLYSCHT